MIRCTSALVATVSLALAVTPAARKIHSSALVFDAHVHVIDRQFYHDGDIGQRMPDGQLLTRRIVRQ